MFKEKVDRWAVLGTVIAIVGVAILFLAGGSTLPSECAPTPYFPQKMA